MHDLTSFGLTILVVSGALSAALLAAKLSARTSIPSAALFLVAAAVASDLFPSLVLSIVTVERIATVALIVILFDGGSSIGWQRFRVVGSADRLARRLRHLRDRRPDRRCSRTGPSGSPG